MTEDPSPNLIVCCSSSSSPVSGADQLGGGALAFHGSASSSLQNDSGFLSDYAPCTAVFSGNVDAEFGFFRPDFRKEQLCGTVPSYDRHVFLCYKNPSIWPPRMEAVEFDRLPRLLYAAVAARKADMKKEVRLTICEGYDGTTTSNGDVLIFPDMVRYRRLTHFDVENFVEEVLVRDGEWLPGNPAILKGSYVFVCCHGSRDRHCGVCGPPLISRFKDEIEARRLQSAITVSPCSHIGGHKYAGNVIIFGSDPNGNTTGHWYGYVTPDDVPTLLEQHILSGEIVEFLWRGQMGLSEDEQMKSQILRYAKKNERTEDVYGPPYRSEIEEAKRFQQEEITSSSREDEMAEEDYVPDNPEKKKKKKKKKLGSSSYTLYWEREDTYAALAAVCAVVSVAVAYKCFKNFS